MGVPAGSVRAASQQRRSGRRGTYNGRTRDKRALCHHKSARLLIDASPPTPGTRGSIRNDLKVKILRYCTVWKAVLTAGSALAPQLCVQSLFAHSICYFLV